MSEARIRGVQAVPGQVSRLFLRGDEKSLVLVQEVPDDRVAERGEVDADLVLAAGERPDAHKRVAGKALDDGVPGR